MPRLSINPPEIQKGPLLYIVQTEFTFKVCSLLHCALYLKICIVTISLKPDIMKIMMIHHPKRFTWTLSSSIIKKLSYIHNSSIGMKESVWIGWLLTYPPCLLLVIFHQFCALNFGVMWICQFSLMFEGRNWEWRTSFYVSAPECSDILIFQANQYFHLLSSYLMCAMLSMCARWV